MSTSVFARFVPKQIRDKFRKAFYLNPDVTACIEPGYRYPAPGSQPPVNPPKTGSFKDRTFDIALYPYAANRVPRQVMVFDHVKRPQLIEAEEVWKNSLRDVYTGVPNADVAVYDKTGLRSAFTSSNAEMEKTLAQQMPDHLPTPEWAKDESRVAAYIEKNEALGLPTGPGVPRKWTTEGRSAREMWW